MENTEIEVGDLVTFGDGKWYEVVRITTETIKTRKAGEITLTKLYFPEGEHQPMYTHSVTGVRKSNQDPSF